MRHERYRPKDFDIRRVMTALFGEPTEWYGQSWWKCPYREEDTPSFTVYGGEQRFYSWPPAGGPGPGTATPSTIDYLIETLFNAGACDVNDVSAGSGGRPPRVGQARDGPRKGSAISFLCGPFDHRQVHGDEGGGPVSWPSVEPIPSSAYQAYCVGLAVGRRREDPVYVCFAALTSWGGGRGRDDLALAELISQLYCGWFEGSSEWFDKFDTEGGDL
jgi:hypothetical protein